MPRLPAVVRVLLAVLLPEALRDEMIGDLTEGWLRRSARDGPVRARLWLWGQVVRLRPRALRPP